MLLNKIETPSDSILNFKKKLAIYIHGWAFCLVVPFAFVQLAQGNPLLAVAIFGFMAFNLLVVYLLVKEDTYLFNGWGLGALASAVVCYSTYVTGIIGVLWAYIAILNFFFLLSWRSASIAVAIFIVIESTIAFYTIDFNLWIRVVVTMVLCACITGSFSWLLTEKQTQLVALATTDPLTGCANRVQLNDTLSEAAYNFHRYKIPTSIIILDIDNFKRINDSHGHLGGDDILKEFSQLLSERIRQSDKLFRYGGEEFIILLPNTKNKDALTLAESIREEIENYSFSIQSTVTSSAGVASLKDGESWDHWLDRADSALYQSKNSGKNKVTDGESINS